MTDCPVFIDIFYGADYNEIILRLEEMSMLEVTHLRHAWPEKAPFTLTRKFGCSQYTFLHFFNSVDILVDGKLVHTRPHACILYDIGTPQKFISNQPLTHDWIHFSGELEDHFRKYGLEFDRLYYPSNAEFITEIVKEMEFERYSGKLHNRDLMLLKTDELFIKLSRACSDESPTVVDRDTNERFRLLRGEMFSNLKEHWTVPVMAKRVGLSPSQFHTIYKNIYGNSPMDDLIRARIDSAKNALLFTNATIGEIAEDLGYNNLTHFMRQFKAMTGMTPNGYRKIKDHLSER